MNFFKKNLNNKNIKDIEENLEISKNSDKEQNNTEKFKNNKNNKTNNPYLLARREWNERYGDYITQAQNWKKIAFISILISAISVTGVIFFASQNHIVPYIVEVDKLGRTVDVYENTKMLEPNENIIKAQLAQFITDVRSVVSDNTVTKNKINRLYAHLPSSGQATTYISNFFKENHPFRRALNETVSVEIKQILPLSDKTWQIEWIETTYSNDGKATGSKLYTATLTISIGNDVNQQVILLNPIGLLVENISWSINFK